MQEAESANAQLIASLRLFSLEVQGASAPAAAAADGDDGEGNAEDLSKLQAELAKQVRVRPGRRRHWERRERPCLSLRRLLVLCGSPLVAGLRPIDVDLTTFSSEIVLQRK